MLQVMREYKTRRSQLIHAFAGIAINVKNNGIQDDLKETAVGSDIRQEYTSSTILHVPIQTSDNKRS